MTVAGVPRVPAKYSYHYEDDIFFARPRKRSYSSSYQLGSFIFDLDSEGRIIGFEIPNASKLFKVPKEALRNMVNMKLTIVVDDDTVYVEMILKTQIRNSQRHSNVIFEKPKPDFLSPVQLNMALA